MFTIECSYYTQKCWGIFIIEFLLCSKVLRVIHKRHFLLYTKELRNIDNKVFLLYTNVEEYSR